MSDKVAEVEKLRGAIESIRPLAEAWADPSVGADVLDVIERTEQP